MRKWWLLLVLLALWNLLGYALARPGSTGSQTSCPASFEPARIVSVAPNLTEILYALGLAESVAGVTLDSDYPPAAIEKPKIGTFWQPNIEAIVALNPDLVLTLDFQQHKDLVRRLQRMGYNCLSTSIWKVDDLFRAITMIGLATKRQSQAEGLIADIQATLQHLVESTAGLARPRVLWVVQREPLRIAGQDTFVNELIELAGGQNAIGPTLHKYPPIGAEQVLASNVDVIIEPAMVSGNLDEQGQQALAYWSRWPRIPAVRDERIYVIDGDLVSRLSPRLCQGLETIARCLRPNPQGD